MSAGSYPRRDSNGYTFPHSYAVSSNPSGSAAPDVFQYQVDDFDNGPYSASLGAAGPPSSNRTDPFRYLDPPRSENGRRSRPSPHADPGARPNIFDYEVGGVTSDARRAAPGAAARARPADTRSGDPVQYQQQRESVSPPIATSGSARLRIAPAPLPRAAAWRRGPEDPPPRRAAVVHCGLEGGVEAAWQGMRHCHRAVNEWDEDPVPPYVPPAEEAPPPPYSPSAGEPQCLP